jgi:hypothetical protein
LVITSTAVTGPASGTATLGPAHRAPDVTLMPILSLVHRDMCALGRAGRALPPDRRDHRHPVLELPDARVFSATPAGTATSTVTIPAGTSSVRLQARLPPSARCDAPAVSRLVDR